MEEILPTRYSDQFPLWVIFLLAVALLMMVSELGFQAGRRWRSVYKVDTSQTAAIMAASLGLLGLLLAFSFNMAGNRFDARKQALLDEANAIGTTWLRSQLLPAQHATEIQDLLERYVELRLAGAAAVSSTELSRAVASSTEIHRLLWQHAIVLSDDDPRAITLGLFISSLNDLIDLHETRMTIARYRMQRSLWGALGFVACAAIVVVGFHAGLSGARGVLPTVLLATTLSVVIVLIIGVDRPGQTLFEVSQQSLLDLRQSMSER